MTRMILGTILGALFAVTTVAASSQLVPTPYTRRPMLAKTSVALQAGAPAAPRPAAPAPVAPQATAPKPPAQPVAFPADAKIGFVNMQFVVSESKLGKSGQDKIQALAAKQNLERVAKNTDIQRLQQEIQAGGSVLSAAVLAQKNQEVDRLTREAQFQEQQRQVDLSTLNQQLLDDFEQKVLPIVEQVRQEKNLWIILSAGDGSGIAAVHPGLDLSQEIIKRLDAGK